MKSFFNDTVTIMFIKKASYEQIMQNICYSITSTVIGNLKTK